MKHKGTINHFEDNFQQLSKELGDLKYDALAEFLNMLSEKILTDGEKDHARNRKKLAENLFEASKKLKDASIAIDKAWTICKPFTESYE